LKKIVYLFTIGTVAVASVALAQDDAAYQGWMKTTGATVGAIRKNIEGKMGDQVAADADKLAVVFKQVGKYGQKRGGADDAVGASEKATTAASQLSVAAKAGNMEQAAAELKNLSATCASCHSAHREKVEGGFKIK
jgi:cytochrome c556